MSALVCLLYLLPLFYQLCHRLARISSCQSWKFFRSLAFSTALPSTGSRARTVRASCYVLSLLSSGCRFGVWGEIWTLMFIPGGQLLSSLGSVIVEGLGDIWQLTCRWLGLRTIDATSCLLGIFLIGSNLCDLEKACCQIESCPLIRPFRSLLACAQIGVRCPYYLTILTYPIDIHVAAATLPH